MSKRTEQIYEVRIVTEVQMRAASTSKAAKLLAQIAEERATAKRNIDFAIELATTVVVPDSLALVELENGDLVEVICKAIRLVNGRNVYDCVAPDFSKAYRNIDQDKICVA